MNLHNNKEDFKSLLTLTAEYKGLSENSIERDYYIVLMLRKLHDSEYADSCVFKGGTSLSKCYPGSIERFSEDIDLTYVPTDGVTDKQYSKVLKKIEDVMSSGAVIEKIEKERNNRNKSANVFFGDKDSRIKLEIGSSVKPHPFSKKKIQSYIHEYLQEKGFDKEIKEYGLETFMLNVLNVERTFIDKLMSVKRHAICGTLNGKVRHIYDVVRLYQMKEIKDFLNDKQAFAEILKETKNTDAFYLEKRNMPKEYDPTSKYAFASWADKFDKNIANIYESLHEELLYTNEKQDFEKAKEVFFEIGNQVGRME